MRKECRGCGVVKPLDAFHRQKTVKDGRKSRCSECCNEASRVWRRENPEKQKQAVDSWRSRNSERYYNRKRERDREYRLEHAERHSDYRRRNAERISMNLARWKSENRDRVREYQRKRRASGYGLPANTLDLERLWATSGGVCGLCLDPIDRKLRWPDLMSASIDHIIPLSMGGLHSQENAQWAHLGCNMRKGNRPSANLVQATEKNQSQEDAR